MRANTVSHLGVTANTSVEVLQKLREEPWRLPGFEAANTIKKNEDMQKKGYKILVELKHSS